MSYIILSILILVLMYTYILYPMLLSNKAKGKQLGFTAYSAQDVLPEVIIIIPARNEEKVIGKKLESILQSDYPASKMQVYIGLDACTDATRSVIETRFSLPNIKIIEFSERQGKPAVLNQIVERHIPQGDALLLLTDANVLFSTSTISELAAYFKDERIGLVDAVIQPGKLSNFNEQDYWNFETEIKHCESLVYGIIPGPSGGCYAIRRSLYSRVPDNFLVDDFFIGFNIVARGYKAILNKRAVCFEDVVTTWKEEFDRKTRIATGNFQNLWYFKRYTFKVWTDLGFIFLSHKVLRWKTPFFLGMIYYILLFKFTLFILIVTLFLPVLDGILSIFDKEFKPLRRFSYFIVMNIAVFSGFIKFCKGVKSNVWQPTKRT